MLYNKLYGLELLDRAVKGIDGVSVLPYRVYRSPQDFKRSHWTGANRVLIRSNLNGDMSSHHWAMLPRKDVFVRVKSAVKQMFKEGRAAFPDRDDFHLILHRVKPRRSYNLSIGLFHDELGLTVKFNGGSFRTKVWRMEMPIHVDFSNLAKNLQRRGFTENQARVIQARLTRAYGAIIREFKRRGMKTKEIKFETSVTTRKSDPTRLEFYDLLVGSVPKPQQS